MQGSGTVHKTQGLWQDCNYDQLTTEPGTWKLLSSVTATQAASKGKTYPAGHWAFQKKNPTTLVWAGPLVLDTNLGGARARGWGG
jgi:hypothetical protein